MSSSHDRSSPSPAASGLTAAAIQKIIAPHLPGLLGIEIVETTPDRVLGRLPVKPEICTTGHILHGGGIMAFADTLGAIGTFMNLPPGATTTTIESSTKFLAAAGEGTVVSGEAIPLHKGRATMVWQTSIRREDGRLCAVVSQTQLVREPKAAVTK
jgi:1,4-dihydroxy-2-naphthoyl-CoA hydrolase